MRCLVPFLLLRAAASLRPVASPIIVGGGGVAAALYGKLQRYEAVFDSGLGRPSLVASEKEVSRIDKMLWNAYCMASVTRGDALPREQFLRYGRETFGKPLYFVDATGFGAVEPAPAFALPELPGLPFFGKPKPEAAPEAPPPPLGQHRDVGHERHQPHAVAEERVTQRLGRKAAQLGAVPRGQAAEGLHEAPLGLVARQHRLARRVEEAQLERRHGDDVIALLHREERAAQPPPALARGPEAVDEVVQLRAPKRVLLLRVQVSAAPEAAHHEPRAAVERRGRRVRQGLHAAVERGAEGAGACEYCDEHGVQHRALGALRLRH
mmetsp:Transcript_29548/g.88351  ORF Transcript_29548/g.88351 Transcript_29548/m.88351 type:complete len:323 (+) Transcript_29548:164-1132(+)